MSHPPAHLRSALADRYRLEQELGAGGMATVYLAQDLRHDRRVAVKVLRPELAAVIGAERFLKEIKVTANLQHPHILGLIDSGEVDGLLYYVMPFVEGESLRDRLTREKQLPVEDAVRITREVASALDYAHRHHVIHRDIKPENILLHEGQALVADFGIALAVSAAGGTRMTETGMSLGTPHYMSPEQAMGQREITARSDVYSLGATLYEMLVGEPPFTGPTAQAIVARVVTEQPRSLVTQRHTIPAHVEAAVLTALEKLPADRWASAAEFANALASSSIALAAKRKGGVGVRHKVGMMLWPVVASVLAALALWGWLRPGAGSGGLSGGAGGTGEIRRWSILLPDSAPLAFLGSASLGVGRVAVALSPDGRTLFYVGRRAATTQLFSRRLDELTVTPLTGTEGAFDPFVSPDGQWVGFFVGSELRKVPVAGGPMVTLAQVPEEAGASWAGDGRILVSVREGDALAWVPSSGGPLQPIPNPQHVNRASPHLLPDGRSALVVYYLPRLGGVIGVTDLVSGRTVALTADGPVPAVSVDQSRALVGQNPRYLPSGHLLFFARGTLVAVAFDPVRLRLAGAPTEVLNDLRQEEGYGGGQYVVSEDGTLIYIPGGVALQGVFVMADQEGRVDTLPFPSLIYGTFDLSPDGRRIATLVEPPAKATEIWVLDLDRGGYTTMATRGIPYLPRWWPDGRRVMFTETSPTPPYKSVTVRQLPGSTGKRDTLAIGWSLDDVAPDTARLMAVGGHGFGAGVWLIPLREPDKATPVDTFPTAWGGTFSRDGRWIAYTSNEAGRYDVYVVSADLHGERQKISLEGGEEPRWSPRGDELVYRWGQRWFGVSVPSKGTSSFGRPRLVLRGPYVNPIERSHDITPDGLHHLLIRGSEDETTGRLTVVTHWLDEVRRLTAPKRP